MDLDSLSKNLSAIEQRIALSCQRAGRKREEVHLLAVSKKQPVSIIQAAYAAGLRDFGENYAQELRDKAKELQPLGDIRWHAIGNVQEKNAKYIADVAAMFHALCDLRVAEALHKRLNRVLPCCVEVHLGGEESKAGIEAAALPQFLSTIYAFSNLRVVGLSCMPPPVQNPEDNRVHFRQLRELGREHAVAELSMGTSDDFEVAIEEGATWIRLGRVLLGERVTLV